VCLVQITLPHWATCKRCSLFWGLARDVLCVECLVQITLLHWATCKRCSLLFWVGQKMFCVLCVLYRSRCCTGHRMFCSVCCVSCTDHVAALGNVQEMLTLFGFGKSCSVCCVSCIDHAAALLLYAGNTFTQKQISGLAAAL
jgi:hypothetical protein